MNLLWIVYILVTVGVGIYLYVTTVHAEQLKRRRSGGERIDLRPDGTVVSSDPAASTPGDLGYVAPPAHHYSPHGLSPVGTGAPEGHDAGSHSQSAGVGTDGGSYGVGVFDSGMVGDSGSGGGSSDGGGGADGGGGGD